MSADQESERVILSPQQAADRILKRLAHRIAAAEAKFMEESKGAEWPRFFRLLVDHCLDCFDAAAILYSPLANGGKRFEIDRLYTELLHRERERTLSRLERLASCFPEETRRELQSQLSHRLEVQIRFWWARVGEALSDLDSGPFLIGDPSASKEKPPSPIPEPSTTSVKAAPDKIARGLRRRTLILPILANRGVASGTPGMDTESRSASGRASERNAGSGEPELQAADSNARSSASERRRAVDAYIAEVWRVKGRRIRRTDIWKHARYQSRTEFERWERNDLRHPNKAAHERFTRILEEKPHCK